MKIYLHFLSVLAVFTLISAVPAYAQDSFDGILKSIDPALEIETTGTDIQSPLIPIEQGSAIDPVPQVPETISTEDEAEDTKEELEDIPDEYLQEAHAFEMHCTSQSNMNGYYDCKCLALKLLDERIAHGPEKSQSLILMENNGTCLDAKEAAGRAYEQCQGFNKIILGNIPREQYCKCVSNTFAKSFEKGGKGPSSRTYVRHQSNAMIACKRPNIAQKYAAPSASGGQRGLFNVQ